MKERNYSLAFLVSPVLGLIEAFSNLKRKHAITVLFWFCLCFGICFSVGTKRTPGSIDGISMRADFEKFKDISAREYTAHLDNFLKFEGGAQDIYIVTVAYVVGKFTDNYHFFFLVLAFVFAYFQLKCLRYFVRIKNYTSSAICIILACLFLWNNIFNINGARFWTASWIALLCVFKTFIDDKPRYIAISLLIAFVHISFAVFPLILLAGYLLKHSDKPLLILFCISWLFSVFVEDLQLTPFKDLDLPFNIMKKVEAYTEGAYADEPEEGTGFYWVHLLFGVISRHYMDILILLIALNRNKVRGRRAHAIVGMMLVLAIVSNFGMIMPVFGRRFFAVNYALVAYSFLLTFGDKKYGMFIYMLPLAWFMNLFYLIKDTIYVLDAGFLLPPIFSFIRFAIAA